MDDKEKLKMNKCESFQDYFNSLKRFICCRTVSLGWQQAGYVLFSQQLPSAEDGVKYPGTVWVEDTESKYQPGDVYKFPAEPTA